MLYKVLKVLKAFVLQGQKGDDDDDEVFHRIYRCKNSPSEKEATRKKKNSL